MIGNTTVQQTSLIRSVTLQPATPLRPGDVLTIRMLGEPGGQASFTIEGVEENVAMTESQPGTYVGTHTVRRGERAVIQNARIMVRLTKAEVTSQAEASARLTFVTARVAEPVITSPVAGTRLGSPIVVRGTAAPGNRVEVQVDYQGSLLVFPLRGTDGHGHDHRGRRR